jgi:hypothetical protein
MARDKVAARCRLRADRCTLVLLLFVFAGLIAGCAPLVDQDQLSRDPAANTELSARGSLGQTFVAQHGGLSGLDIWLGSAQPADGWIRLHLRSDPQATTDIAVAELPLASVTAPGFYRFSFPPLPDSHNRYLYAFLDIEGAGAVQVGSGSGSSYLSGALYRDRRSSDAQLAFRLLYEPGWAGLELARALVSVFGLLGIVVLFWIVPGWALLRLSRLGKRHNVPLDIGDRAGVAVGISLALYPVLVLWIRTLGWHLVPGYVWALPLCALVLLALLNRPWRLLQSLRRSAHIRWSSEDTWANLTLIGAVFLVMAVRLLVVRTLEAPSWGDSVQHAVIAQLFDDHGGLFNSWEPYAPYHTLTVQFGFSVAVAILSWVTRIETAKATLLMGQLLNGLAILVLYPLGRRIAGGNRWAGIGAIIVAGLLMPMPAFYVNWGRYAQLAGQVVLPIAIWLLWDFLEARRLSWPAYGLACLSLAGLALSYYRMPFYYVAFVLAWLILWALPRWRTDLRCWGSGMARLAMVAGGALLLLLPWALHVRSGALSVGLEAGFGLQVPLDAVRAEYQIWRDIQTYVPWPLLLMDLVALAWATFRMRWNVLLVGLWTGIMASLVAGRLIGLPGVNYLQNFALMIALYIPTGLLCGWLISEAAGPVTRRWARLGPPLISVLLLGLALWGVRGQLGIVRPEYVMVTRPDRQAMAWIREHTPTQAKFLVEGFRIYGGRSAVGADAGWWIPLLADRANTMPPQYAMLNEKPIIPNYTQQVVSLVETLETNAPASAAGLRALCGAGVTHVYIGQTQGLTGFGVAQLFAPDDFISQPAFKLVYQGDRVYIFALSEGVCETGQPLP